MIPSSPLSKFMEDFSVLIIANIPTNILTFLLLEDEITGSKMDNSFGKISYIQLTKPINLNVYSKI